jgi:hypothetical protein
MPASQHEHYPRERARRVRVAVALLVAFFLLSSGLTLQRAWDLKRATAREGDWVTRYHERFDLVKSMLPSQGVIPYVTDYSVGSDEGTIIPQYALAPRILDRDAVQRTQGIVLAVYSNPAFLPSPSAARLRLIADFGNGVKVFRVE